MIEHLYCFQETESESFMSARIQMHLTKNSSFLHIFNIFDEKQGNTVVPKVLGPTESGAASVIVSASVVGP
jgi:hypothetical protein